MNQDPPVWVVGILAIIAIVLITLIIRDKRENEKDFGRCLQEESTVVLIPMSSGDSSFLMPMEQTTCKRWEFPEGRLLKKH